MLEMPDLFERNMTLGNQAFDDQNYEMARDYFEAAYNIKDDLVANTSLTKSLVELKEFEAAYSILCEKKNSYLKTSELQLLYFNILLQLNYFFEIEKLLVSLVVENPGDLKKAYDISKEYHLMINKTKYRKLQDDIRAMVDLPKLNQGIVLKKVKFLPKEMVVDVAKDLLVDERVSIFSRSEICQLLVQVKLDEEIEVLTFNGEIKSFIPKTKKVLSKEYGESVVLKEVSHFFDTNNPSIKNEVEKSIKLHIGCLYPFVSEVMEPTDKWITSYIEKYQGNTSETDFKKISQIQNQIDSEVLKMMSFN
ncbi:hypothetical protein JZO82_14325 [Vagococcus fluvialis]|uniref:hypothetical protein n=1 Tax=Vagococcus fluvialis TaxID=2738 RepID=UPI001A8C689B|nr:hypothetical protein [Vagococcus fluvialis]MBO0430340.1 hypothetical protein [Vagococcus fluvialis]